MIFRRLRGEVVEFDPEVGLGTVTAGSGSDSGSWMFHCSQLVDGSQLVEVGAAVEFEVRPVGPGRWEATSISKLPDRP